MEDLPTLNNNVRRLLLTAIKTAMMNESKAQLPIHECKGKNLEQLSGLC